MSLDKHGLIRCDSSATFAPGVGVRSTAEHGHSAARPRRACGRAGRPWTQPAGRGCRLGPGWWLLLGFRTCAPRGASAAAVQMPARSPGRPRNSWFPSPHPTSPAFVETQHNSWACVRPPHHGMECRRARRPQRRIRV